MLLTAFYAVPLEGHVSDWDCGKGHKCQYLPNQKFHVAAVPEVADPIVRIADASGR